MLKKLFILLFIPIFLCSCHKNDESKELITFSSWGSITEVQILNKIINDFETENTDIKINFIHIPQNYFQKIHLLFASNQAPDVIFLNNLYLPLYISKLEDLTNLADKSDYYSESLNALSREGKLYAIPRDISNLVLYRNKELVKSTPKNLDELLAILKKSKKYNIGCERDVYFMYPYIMTMNEDIYHPQKSLNFYKNLEGKYAPTPSQVGSSTLAQMFIDEKIGLYMSGRWMYPKISEKAKFNWDVITFPGIVPLDASGWAISKSSKHKEAAKKFVQYLSSTKSSEYFLSTGLIVPARINVSKEIDNKVFLEAISKSKPIPVDKNYKKITDKMNKEIFK